MEGETIREVKGLVSKKEIMGGGEGTTLVAKIL